MRPSLEDQTLAKYQIIKEIGHGSSGTVYLGHDPFIDRPVAIKVALEGSISGNGKGELYQRLFFNEAQAAGMLKHPNITSIFDAGIDRDFCYIVMEYVHGGRTLEDFCTLQSLLPLDQAIGIIYKCANALDYAHKKGVIHRDIKPRNILVTEDMDIKVSDFGIAVIPGLPESEMLGHAGSPMYMSPEQIRREKITNQTDLFSVGVLAYELIAGTHPFAAEDAETIEQLILSSNPLPLGTYRADVPDVLERVVERAMAKSIHRRYKTGMDLGGDLSLVFDFLTPSEEHISRQQKFNALRELDFFRDFADSEVWELINASAWYTAVPNEEIVLEGELDKSFYVIISGSVQVSKNARPIDTLAAGDCFGEMGFISGRHRSASVRARENSTIMKIRSPMIERASVNCQLQFHKLFLHTVIERLSRATDRIASDTVETSTDPS